MNHQLLASVAMISKRCMKRLHGILLLVAALNACPAAYTQVSNAPIPFYPQYCSDNKLPADVTAPNVNSGKSACDQGFDNWIRDGLTSHRPLYLPAGFYRLSNAHIVQLHQAGQQAASSLTIYCDGPQIAQFLFDSGMAPPNIQFIGNDVPSAPDLVSGLWIQNCGFYGSTPGALMQIGATDYGDQFRGMKLDYVAVRNVTTSGNAIALQLNNVTASFINAVANAASISPAEGAQGPPYTTLGFAALECRQCTASTFHGSYGVSSFGVVLADGANTGNSFYSLDLEETVNAVRIVNAQSTDNTFLAGQYSDFQTGIVANAGSGNVFVSPNFLPRCAGNASQGNPAGSNYSIAFTGQMVGASVTYVNQTLLAGNPCKPNYGGYITP